MGEDRKKLVEALNIIVGECVKHGYCPDCPLTDGEGCNLIDIGIPCLWDTESMVKQEE